MLTINICTKGERIRQVENLVLPEPRKDLKYVISWQPPFTNDCIPQGLIRPDINIIQQPDNGLSANRNNALQHTTAPYAVIADDDVRYNGEQIDNLIRLINQYPKVDIFCLRIRLENGKLFKNYPTEPYQYANQPKGAYVSSCELVVKMSDKTPRFDTNYGIGAQHMHCGEEEIFLIDADRNGLNIAYFPMDLCTMKEGKTSGDRFLSDPYIQHAKGAVLYRKHGFINAVLRVFKTAFNPIRRSSLHLFYEMLKGIYYGRKYTL